MTTDETVKVTCHCGAVELRVTLLDGLNTARRCDCSYCRRRGAIMVSAALGGVDVIKGETLQLYTFGTGVAKHYFCGTCGIYTHHQRRSNPLEFGVNVGAIEEVNPSELGDVPWYDGVNHPADR
ncbi:GFA family protein [Celeribacter arenosi]|uniref:GFA family protein n=1 Tax=Celeribacter arenosi TaxID=792649 RepID=A0ABP7K934_9RHOB